MDLGTITASTWSTSAQIFVPVTADGIYVRDNGGDLVAMCSTPQAAERIAYLLNMDAIQHR